MALIDRFIGLGKQRNRGEKIMNDLDIVLIIESWINEQKKDHFVINFKELDSILSLPDGSTERNIKAVVNKVGSDIDIGINSASITITPVSFLIG